jgi:hypothetical protein
VARDRYNLRFKEDAVRIKARSTVETFTYDFMGFRDRKSQTANPIKCWEMFRFLAILSRSTSGKTWRDVIPEREIHNLKKRISLLREELKRFFNINADPIPCKKGDEYQAVFNLAIEEHVIQPMHERWAGHADEGEDEEDANG